MVGIEIDEFWILIGIVSVFSIGVGFGAVVWLDIAPDGSVLNELSDDDSKHTFGDVSVGKPWVKIDENATHAVWAKSKNDTHSYIRIEPRSDHHLDQGNLGEDYYE